MSLADDEANFHPEENGVDPKGEKFSPTIAALNAILNGIALSDLLISIFEVIGTFKLLQTFVVIVCICWPKKVVGEGINGDPVANIETTFAIEREPPIDAKFCIPKLTTPDPPVVVPNAPTLLQNTWSTAGNDTGASPKKLLPA